MHEEINSNNIHYRWLDGNIERKLSKREMERIQRLLLRGKVEGEIIQHNEGGKDFWGWWKIPSKQ